MRAAASLFHQHGVSATSLEDVLVAAGAGKGQLYRYFRSKEDLTAAVVRYQLDAYLRWQRYTLERLESWEELERYLHELAAGHSERRFVGGCPVGSLAIELADQDEALREELAEGLRDWRVSLTAGLSRLARDGCLRDDVAPERLAAATLATIQGAYLLATVHRDGSVMEEALEEALACLRPHGRATDG